METLRKIGGSMPGILRDLAGIAGAGSIAFGAWQIYAPAGLIVGGALVLTAVYFLARAEG
jgi:hypothetical protein